MKLVTVTCTLFLLSFADGDRHSKHHHHKHHHHNRTSAASNATPQSSPKQQGKVADNTPDQPEAHVLQKMKSLEEKLANAEAKSEGLVQRGKIQVNAPLPSDFSERFVGAVAVSTGCDKAEVKVVDTESLNSGVAVVEFEAPLDIVKAVQSQASDETSKLAAGPLHSFLVAKDDEASFLQGGKLSVAAKPADESKQIDVDTEMPYGELEPFGREDTAQEMTEASVQESNEMVDQIERAEVAEEKRSIVRALTRLRGAAITSFDGIARSQTGNIDEYNKVHQWRNTHPLHHLADEESDISMWAFPDNAD